MDQNAGFVRGRAKGAEKGIKQPAVPIATENIFPNRFEGTVLPCKGPAHGAAVVD